MLGTSTAELETSEVVGTGARVDSVGTGVEAGVSTTGAGVELTVVRHSVELTVVRTVTLPPMQSVCQWVSQGRVKVKSTINCGAGGMKRYCESRSTRSERLDLTYQCELAHNEQR